jgi:hypothetical protein
MKKLLYWSLGATVLMIGGPCFAVCYGGMDGMGLCFLLFLAINPTFSFVSGIFAGREIRRLWPLPLITSGLFIVGATILFAPLDPAFFLYGAIYLGIGSIAMGAGALIKRIKS